MLREPLEDLFIRSKTLILDFAQIPNDAPKTENIKIFFEACAKEGTDPRLPQNRQRFNDRLLAATGKRYLVSRYAEDRSAMLLGSHIAKEGRVLHLGIDIFSKDLERVYAPCDGKIVRTGKEIEPHGYGYYVILQPNHIDGIYFFLGHLSKDLPPLGSVQAGQPIARLGDFRDTENGGWSRHLHLQVLTVLPPEGQTPPGYATKTTIARLGQLYPDPLPYFPNWRPA